MYTPRRVTLLTCALLFIAALLPRVFGLGQALTTDEAYHWLNRSVAFLAALRAGRFADTMLTGHPGVTTMWLGSLGLLLERAFYGAAAPASVPFPMHLTLLRLPLALACAAGVPLCYLLLRRLVAPAVALTAALLWASDPFLVAHSRVLHLDALLSMLMLLALLTLLAAGWTTSGPRTRLHTGLLALAGALTGAALLTKATALLLLPAGALVLGAWAWGALREAGGLGAQAGRLLRGGSLWLGAALLMMLALWPALWVAPAAALGSVLAEALLNGGAPHAWGNFLLGQAANDPGPLFYPLTLLGRTPPWSALGLLAATGLALASLRRRTPSPRHLVTLSPAHLLTLVALLLFTALTVAGKKADRYALPLVPLRDLAAASGLVALGGWLPQRVRQGGALLVGAAAAVTLAWLQPYYLAYYSPLIGGQPLAPQLVPVGWGEGLEAAAEWLNAQPDIGSGAVATWSPPTLQAYLHTRATWQGDVSSGAARYLVVYVSQAQTGKESQYYGTYYPGCAPAHTVRVRGIDYAWIYRVARRADAALDARFGNSLVVEGYQVQPPDDCTSNKLALTLELQPLAAPEQQLFLFVHVLGSEGQRIGQLDLPLEGVIPSDHWQSGRKLVYTTDVPLSSQAAPGEYELIIGIYAPATAERLPLHTRAPAAAPRDGPDSLSITTFRLWGQLRVNEP